MKKRKAKPQKSKTKATAAPAPTQTRRAMLRNMGLYTLGAGALGGAGWIGVSTVRAGAAEYDLTRIGQGKPSIVQIHDPQCPMCQRLQKEARAALKSFNECDIVYLIANIRTKDGRDLADEHGVPHVTLLLFDGDGKLQDTLRGVRQREELTQHFTTHHQNG